MHCTTLAVIKFDSITLILQNRIDAYCTFATMQDLSRLFGTPIL